MANRPADKDNEPKRLKETILERLNDPKAEWSMLMEAVVIGDEVVATREYLEDNKLTRFIPAKFKKDEKRKP